jgi:hypothetical protein
MLNLEVISVKKLRGTPGAFSWIRCRVPLVVGGQTVSSNFPTFLTTRCILTPIQTKFDVDGGGGVFIMAKIIPVKQFGRILASSKLNCNRS